MAVPLALVVTASAIGEGFAREVVRVLQDALARNEGDNGHTLKLTKITKTLDMLRVEDEGLRVSLVTFQLKGDAKYWWKYVKGTVGATWVTFTEAMSAKYFPPSTLEGLREQFVELPQGTTPLAQFEMRFTSLSRFAPELVATKERRCYEFERRLSDDIREKVIGSM
ncbi:uncharacterized protein LOC114308767 [Camellia sinensis]|uniref:uncharacterized protein LOC114308767 n=1 Tax=Camellia sinensis TaxID=4442 RepID=UPI001036D15D|nr:uncharacterized protein LOC114308767 [Camellia sinensis]